MRGLPSFLGLFSGDLLRFDHFDALVPLVCSPCRVAHGPLLYSSACGCYLDALVEFDTTSYPETGLPLILPYWRNCIGFYWHSALPSYFILSHGSSLFCPRASVRLTALVAGIRRVASSARHDEHANIEKKKRRRNYTRKASNCLEMKPRGLKDAACKDFAADFYNGGVFLSFCE